MEVCETSMENFYKTMHTIQEIESLDLLLKRMISHVRNTEKFESISLFVLSKIVDALRFLKSKNILHRDVKPSNILINQNPIIFKLCDFGICGQLVDSVSRTIMIGTEIYLAV
jgi:serine/threonine protein kinase